MKVILLNTLDKIGKKGHIISVKNGYARNYLIPTQKALLATENNIKVFENTRTIEQKKETNKINHAVKRMNTMKLIGSVVFFMKSSKKNKIFGSIGIKDIIKNFYDMGILVHKSEIKLPNGLLRYLGVHTAIFAPYKNMSLKFKISILSI